MYPDIELFFILLYFGIAIALIVVMWKATK
jgi:hypothetical protein